MRDSDVDEVGQVESANHDTYIKMEHSVDILMPTFANDHQAHRLTLTDCECPTT